MQTKERILDYIATHGQGSASELAEIFDVSRQTIHTHLKTLVEDGRLEKKGSSPKVLYILSQEPKNEKTVSVSAAIEEILNERFFYVSPTGTQHTGVDAFYEWCKKKNQPFEKTAHEYIATLKKYDAFKKNGFINGMQKLRDTFQETYLDELYYLDFYSIERFGKTKLGQMLLYAKQSENKELMNGIIQEVQDPITQLITQKNIDGVLFIPPTVPRRLQLMTQLAKGLTLAAPIITNVMKVTNDIAIPQKSLNKIEDRIENARKSIYVTEKKSYNNILIIDDAVGSGSTLNETAKKVKDQNICKGKVIGLALVGSFKGFDVISEI